MKKILMFAGAVFAVLIVPIVVLVAVVDIEGNALGSESKQYSDSAIRAICTSWDESQLINRASREMLTALPSQAETQNLFAQWRRFGPMTSLDSLQGDANVLFGNGMRVTAGYIGIAHFKNGAAQVKIALVKRDGAWRVLGFSVYGNLDPRTLGSALRSCTGADKLRRRA